MCSGDIVNVECAFCGLTDTYNAILNHMRLHDEEGLILTTETQPTNEDIESDEDHAVCIANSNNNNEGKSEWTEGETKLLLDYYEQYLSQVGPMKKFKRKKDMWIKISENLKTVLKVTRSPLQCENRYKTVLKRKKKAVTHNRRTGESPESVPYEDELNKISAIDDSIEPEVKIDQGHRVTKEKQSTALVPVTKKRTEKTVQEVLLDIHTQKEEAKERRHREKMEFMRDMMASYFPKDK